MANILQILIDADDRASQVIAGTQSKLKDMMGNARAIGTAMTVAGGAITGSLLAMSTKFTQTADDIAKFSDKTGLSVENLSALKFAAEQSGTTLEAIDKGMKKLGTTMFDAANGSKASVEALDALGLSVDQLMAMSPDQRFMAVSTAIAGVEDASMKAALAQRVFGRAGTELLPMLKDGEDGIAALTQQAKELGLTFDEDAARASERFNDSISALKASFTGVTQTIAANVIPVMTPLIEKFGTMVGRVSNWSRENPILSKTLFVVVGGAGALMSILGPMLMILPSLVSGWKILASTTRIAAAAQWAMNVAMGANPIGLVIVGIAALVAAGVLLIKNWDSVKYFALQAWGYIKTTILGVIGKLLSAYEKLWGWLPAIGPKIRAAHSALEAQIARERAVIAQRGADRRIAIAEAESKRAKAIADRQKSYMGAGSNYGASGGADTVGAYMSGKAAEEAEKANAKIAKKAEAEEKKAAASVAREKKAILAEHTRAEKAAIYEVAAEAKKVAAAGATKAVGKPAAPNVASTARPKPLNAGLAAAIYGNMSSMINDDGTLKGMPRPLNPDEVAQLMPVNNAGWSPMEAWKESGYAMNWGEAPTALTPKAPAKVELNITVTKEFDVKAAIEKAASAVVDATVRKTLAQTN